MADKEINTNKYFVELTDIGGGTIGYTVPFPEELLREIIKQNKQLARKTQEYEELKAYTQRQENQRETYYKEFLKLSQECDRYRRALEEIDKAINNIFDRCLGHKTDGCTPVHNVCEELINILDIINKVKEEINEK